MQSPLHDSDEFIELFVVQPVVPLDELLGVDEAISIKDLALDGVLFSKTERTTTRPNHVRPLPTQRESVVPRLDV